jgi:hypothetical protein
MPSPVWLKSKFKLSSVMTSKHSSVQTSLYHSRKLLLICEFIRMMQEEVALFETRSGHSQVALESALDFSLINIIMLCSQCGFFLSGSFRTLHALFLDTKSCNAQNAHDIHLIEHLGTRRLQYFYLSPSTLVGSAGGYPINSINFLSMLSLTYSRSAASR